MEIDQGVAFFDDEFDALTKMFTTENVDLMEFFSNDHENDTSMFWQAMEANKLINATESFFSSNSSDDNNNTLIINTDNNFLQFFSEESSNDPNYAHNSIQSEYMDFNVIMDQKIVDNYNSNHVSSKEISSSENSGNAEDQMKRKFEELEDQQMSKKKPQAQKRQRNAQSKSKKNKKITSDCNEEVNEETNTQSSSCSSIDDDEPNNASQELSKKTRASRGAATDPQSLYARKRRERINERLRILQNLVPNGTKVDISTMLEEAVHYVKFLQLQIKLLSSDDMWMFAPIAYNGMDIGHYQKMLPTL